MTAPCNQRPLPVRNELIGRTPYGAPQIDVDVRMNTNESPHAPSPAVVEDIRAAVAEIVGDLNRYPDREAVTLRSLLADYLQATTSVPLSSDHIWAANGSNEILLQTMQAFAGPGRSALGFEPTYSMHRSVTEATGAAYHTVARREDFGIDAATALAAVEYHRPDVVFICNPNNPTGTYTDLDTIEAIYDATAGIVIIDEAYIEFCTHPSAARLLTGRPRLLVIRTISKAFGLAGVRVGYLAANPEVVAALRLVRLPYHLSSLTQAVAVAALSRRVELLSTVPEVVTQRERIVDGLSAMGLQVYPSDANFVLFSVPGDAAALWQRLVDRQVLIRDVGIPGHLRVTAGTAEETAAFLETIRTSL